jgi:dTMP kinase
MVEVIEPALSAGRAVVCDRFSGSTLAYQGYGRGLPLEELDRLSRWASAGVTPDRVILLRVPAAVAAERVGRRGGLDRMEGAGKAFFDRVAAGFASLAAGDPQRWRVVDGTGTIDDVAARVLVAASG